MIKTEKCKGQGVANVASGFLGGMAGCAMIGQSIINVKSGGRTRLSSFSAGVFLLIMVVFISDWLKAIPMAALVAVMIYGINWNILTGILYAISANILSLAIS
ncbi:Sul1delta fusion protein [Acinetobacter baumannii]|nr:Sul1delta fusion protein [Acinetobacter baumannii]